MHTPTLEASRRTMPHLFDLPHDHGGPLPARAFPTARPAFGPTCPLCAQPAGRVLAHELRYGEGAVWLCEPCELGVLAEAPHDRTSSTEYYDGAYRRRHGPRLDQPAGPAELFDAYVDFQEARIARLRPYLSGARLLEVGCAAGYFLANVKPLVQEAVGVDLDSTAVAFAAEKTGCRVLCGPLEDTPLELGSFDVVCAFQTLEHVDDPLVFLRSLARYAKPDGLVCVEVPNLCDPLLTLYDVPAYRRFYFHAAHRHYFSAASLQRAARQAGLRGIVHPTQDYNFFNHLHWRFLNGPQESCRPGLSPVQWPMRNDAPIDLRVELTAWAQRADREYKAILARHGHTENLLFLGSRVACVSSAAPAITRSIGAPQ